MRERRGIDKWERGKTWEGGEVGNKGSAREEGSRRRRKENWDGGL